MLAEDAASPIRFSHHRIGFVLENGETPRKHAPETMAGGVAVFDYDNDGDLDIYFTNGARMPDLKKSDPKYWNRLFANDGRANFRDVTQEPGLAGSGYDTGVSVADYDHDGDRDVFLAGVHRNTLYRNEGDGTFQDVTAEAGLDQPGEDGPLWAVDAAWLGYDRDGDLDLLVVNYLCWDPKTEPECADYCHPKVYDGSPNRLFRNNGDGSFTDVSEGTGIREHVRKVMGAAVADFDRDGIGAEVKVVTEAGAQYNHATTSVGYASSSAGPVHFGLGRNAVAKLVEIRWPTGKVQRISNVTGDRVLRIREPAE